ncbi:MAG: hypothetical protein MJ072_06735, partial [Clostridia bacterium]|nr:hypothetical protein [Clostridia bacterium]
MKKILSFITVIALSVTALFGTFNVGRVFTAQAETATKKTIDIYFIAGQSNAAGSSAMLAPNETDFDSEKYTEGFSNVLYYGGVPGGAELSLASPGVHLDFQPTKKGLGSNAMYIGPELGMAEELSKYYNETSGRTAVIVKYAIGSASLDGRGGVKADG